MTDNNTVTVKIFALESLQDELAIIRGNYDKDKLSVIPQEVKDTLAAVDEHYKSRLDLLQHQIDSLQKEIRLDVIELKTGVQGNTTSVTYNPGTRSISVDDIETFANRIQKYASDLIEKINPTDLVRASIIIHHAQIAIDLFDLIKTGDPFTKIMTKKAKGK